MEIKLFENESVENIKGDVEEKIKEKRDDIFKAVDGFNSCVKDLMTDVESLDIYLSTNDLPTMLSKMRDELDYLGKEIGVNVNVDSDNLNNVLVPLIDVGISCVLLYERLMIDVKNGDVLRKRKVEELQELSDLEAAKPIFSMLKNEVQKWDWGQDFDEFSISRYIMEMVELSKKHNVNLEVE